ncbi:hypothetical protein GcM3_204039 [Golovinomyces cichoracearum]|uniref:Uncharacterized protein n=1 Tax=Golovinomyces cichoracearum TaxID=62708 RepID=A0A420HCK3_9PEZI|nr:hypothetical protein GcM3_204039 [Golovinomyces cichoracearum]
MDIDTSSSSSILPSSPSPPGKDLSKIPRLESSIWSPKMKTSQPLKAINPPLLNLSDLISDPITMLDFEKKDTFEGKNPNIIIRKRHAVGSPDTSWHFRKNLKVTRVTEPSVKKRNCPCSLSAHHQQSNASTQTCQATSDSSCQASIALPNPQGYEDLSTPSPSFAEDICINSTEHTPSPQTGTSLPLPSSTEVDISSPEVEMSSSEIEISTALDCIIKAYTLTSDHSLKPKLLNLANFVRIFTETGEIQPISPKYFIHQPSSTSTSQTSSPPPPPSQSTIPPSPLANASLSSAMMIDLPSSPPQIAFSTLPPPHPSLPRPPLKAAA